MPNQNDDYEYQYWKGEAGLGLALRESIQQHNEEVMAKRKTAEPVIPTIKIDADVIALIRTGTWHAVPITADPAFKMPMTSDRKLYQKTAKVLESLGGKWNRKEQATVFDDEDAELCVREACETGEYIDYKKVYQFFETPSAVAIMMVNNLCLHAGKTYRVLEPSAGHGALILACAAACVTDGPDIKLTAIELDANKRERLDDLCGPNRVCEHVLTEDFLKTSPQVTGLFDRVIMNPPFTRCQDMAHVRHAYDFLEPGGILVAVMSPAFEYRSDMTSQLFRDWFSLCQSTGYASHVPLPEGSFKVSGTNVRTVLVTIKKGK